MVSRRAMEREARAAKIVLANTDLNVVASEVIKYLIPGLPTDFPCKETELPDFMDDMIGQTAWARSGDGFR
jgi:hypothetical protein